MTITKKDNSMAIPSLATEAAAAGPYPALRFNQRERKLLASVKVYVDALSPDTVITTQGDLIIGDASGNAIRLAKGASGTVPVAGASTVAYALLANANISSSAAIAYSKLALTNSLVAADLTSGAVTLAKLDTGITFSHRVFAAGSFTTAGGDTAEVITVASMASTDIAIVTVKTLGVSPTTVVAAAAATGQINVTMAADPSTDHVLSYVVLRAAV